MSGHVSMYGHNLYTRCLSLLCKYCPISRLYQKALEKLRWQRMPLHETTESHYCSHNWPWKSLFLCDYCYSMHCTNHLNNIHSISILKKYFPRKIKPFITFRQTFEQRQLRDNQLLLETKCPTSNNWTCLHRIAIGTVTSIWSHLYLQCDGNRTEKLNEYGLVCMEKDTIEQ